MRASPLTIRTRLALLIGAALLIVLSVNLYLGSKVSDSGRRLEAETEYIDVLGAANVSFMLVLAVHHEVQYLAFTYAMARREGVRGIGPFSYVLWPGLGLAGAVAGGWLELRWLAPLGIGGLFCHYWLDGRIWTRRVASP